MILRKRESQKARSFDDRDSAREKRPKRYVTTYDTIRYVKRRNAIKEETDA